MYVPIALFFLAPLLVTGCSNLPLENVSTEQTDEKSSTIVEDNVLSVSSQVENNLKDFSQFFMYQNEKQKLPNRSSLAVSDKIMAKKLFIDWSGPVSSLLDELAQMMGYQYQAIGATPVIPALVTLHHEKIALVDIIRDVSFQVHQSADIAIFPDQKLIELRYKG